MATIADIKKRATELSGKTAPNSITPKEVGQLFYDLAGAVPEGGTGDGGVPVVDITELDGYNLNAGVITATGPVRFAVACDVGGPAQFSVGVCEMFSDNMMHQTTQVLTTHYTLDADGTVNPGAHTDGRLHTYWRSCKIMGEVAWGAWTPLYSYNEDGYVYRGVATPETDPTGTDTPWCRVFYLAGPGTYKNFGGLTVEPGELAALLYDGNGTSGSWRKETVPASSSGSLRLDEVVDLSGITDGTKWTDEDKVNALYNIRNGSYIYHGDGDGGQAASVELTQDSSGSRLEIALLGTDGHLKVYAADISDADVTATWSVKDYDLSQVAGLPGILTRLTDIEGKITPIVSLYTPTYGLNLRADVILVELKNTQREVNLGNIRDDILNGHHTIIYVYSNDTVSTTVTIESSDTVTIHNVHAPSRLGFGGSFLIRFDVDTIISEDGTKHAYITMANNVGLPTEGGGEIFNDYANNEASDKYSHAEGVETKASGRGSHAEGYCTEASADYSHAQGYHTRVQDSAGGFAAGMYNYDTPPAGLPNVGDFLIMFGVGTSEEDRKNALMITRGGAVYILNAGGYDGTSINGATPLHEMVGKGTGMPVENGGDIFGNYELNVASGQYSHAEGSGTKATRPCAHAEGYSTTAGGDASHAEGYKTEATGLYSHSEGCITTASNQYEHAEGLLNKSNPGTRHSIGIGTRQKLPSIPEDIRKNAFEVMDNGDVYVFGIGGYDGTNTGADGVQTLQEVISSILQSQNNGTT